ncbi:BQ5605_C004g02858 [Microbotryum silenes-dioicae]|uniref:BQ5605_C004g02858 protein n=1 Tax=Microbotryum silenes-dioicae TaxID=796604 RepID=A0A2X0MDH5_9BASI|nr:BQ5605_C004g02858 [Microbotryum silenes-dioicae]
MGITSVTYECSLSTQKSPTQCLLTLQTPPIAPGLRQQALEPFLRLLTISHRRRRCARSMPRVLDARAVEGAWLEPKPLARFVHVHHLYLLREDGGAGTGGNAHTRLDDPLTLPDEVSAWSDAYQEERAFFRRVSGGKDVICFSYQQSTPRCTGSLCQSSFNRREDGVVTLIVGLFGWKDQVPAVVRMFASAGFVSLTAGGRHQVDELKAAEVRFRNQSLKRIVEAMLLVPLLRDRATHPATADPRLEAALRASYRAAHKIVPDAATFDTIYASARGVIFDAIQVVEEHLDKMIDSTTRDQLRRQHTLWLRPLLILSA